MKFSLETDMEFAPPIYIIPFFDRNAFLFTYKLIYYILK